MRRDSVSAARPGDEAAAGGRSGDWARPLFISTEADNSSMLALLQRENWTFAGAVEGPNWNDIAEQFFFKDVETASAT